MLLNYRKPWLAGWLLVLLMATPAWSQGLEDAQFFAPAEMDQFGGGVRPHEGFFASVDYLRWTIQAPEKTPIGFPGTRTVFYDTYRSTIQSNTIDTGFLTSAWTSGTRIEVGDVSEHHGWLVSFFQLQDQSQDAMFSSVDMVFQDLEVGDPAHRHLAGYKARLAGYASGPVYIYEQSSPGHYEIVDLPLSFDTVDVKHNTDVWGVEANYLLRLHPNDCGGIFEFYLGARYVEFKDVFDVAARGDRFTYDSSGSVTGPNSILGDSFWNSISENHIVGPQLGARLFKSVGRWTLSTEGRFLAGANFQNVRERGTLGTKTNRPWGEGDNQTMNYQWASPAPPVEPFVPIAGAPVSFNHSYHDTEWSPAIELRLEAKCQITQAISARFGWDVFWIDGIARASDMIDYTLREGQVFGVAKDNNRQDVLMQGFHVGLELNR